MHACMLVNENEKKKRERERERTKQGAFKSKRI
jgi:hypothetical protein